MRILTNINIKLGQDTRAAHLCSETGGWGGWYSVCTPFLDYIVVGQQLRGLSLLAASFLPSTLTNECPSKPMPFAPPTPPPKPAPLDRLRTVFLARAPR